MKKLQQQAEIQLNEERTVEIKLSKLEVEMTALKDHLEDTYELTLDEAEKDFPFSMDEDLARKKVILLKAFY